MSSKRVFYLMCSLVLLLVVAVAGSAYEINSMLGGQSNKLVDSKAKLAALQQEQVELKQAKKDILTYNDLYQISKVVVPENKDQAEAVRQIVNIASQNNINLLSVTFPKSTLGGNQTTTSAATSTSLGTNGPSAIGGASPSLSQLKKVSNIPGVYVLELDVSCKTNAINGNSYQDMINFLAGLEQNRLTALISSIDIGSGSSNYTFDLTLDIYIKPGGVS